MFQKIFLPVFILYLLFAFPAVGAEGVHSQNLRNEEAIWGFGQSANRNDALWRKGKAGSELNSHQKNMAKRKSANTATAIEQALKEAESRLASRENSE